MPLYEYRCKKCGHHFEKIQSFSAPDVKQCPVCQGEVERLISAPAIRFKGTGWYETDYAHKGNGSRAGSSSTEHSSNGKPAVPESKPAASESKPAKAESNGTAAAATAASTSGKSE